MMADLADGFVALPGGWGSERVFRGSDVGRQLRAAPEAVRLAELRGFFDGLLSFIEHLIDERFVRRECRLMVILVSELPIHFLERFDQYVPLVVPKWI